MTFRVAVHILPRRGILDPQGKATQHGLASMGFSSLSRLRIGKRIAIELEAPDKTAAEKIVKEACEKLLVNQIMEQFEFAIKEN